MRTFAFACLLLSIASNGRLHGGDGILGAKDADAEEYLAEFAAARDALPRRFAAVGRGFMTSPRDGGFRETEISFIEAEHPDIEGERARFSAFSLYPIRDTSQEMREGQWDQTLVLKGKRHWRRGIPVGRYAVDVSEDEDTPPEESKMHRMTPVFDSFYLSIGDSGSFQSSQLNASYVFKILHEAELQSAKYGESGLLETVWYLGDNKSTVLDIAFDRKQGNRPVNVVWAKRLINDDGSFSSDRRVVTVVRSRWHEVRFPNESIWSVIDQVEYNFRIEWRHLDDDSKFPRPQHKDWREVFASEFMVDWLSPISNFRPHDLEFPGI
jgi:hypothetical protein